MTLIGGSNPFFVGNAGIGTGSGPVAPQIRCFDVFYVEPVVVGLQVVGEDSDICNPAPVSVNNSGMYNSDAGDCGC